MTLNGHYAPMFSLWSADFRFLANCGN